MEDVRRVLKFAVFPVLWLSAPLFAHGQAAAAPTANFVSRNAASIDVFLRSSLATLRIPGIAIGVVDHDRIAYLAAFGVADPSGRPATPQTPFIIGSLSKSFTALATMQLVEGGRIDLDSSVTRYIPWFTLADVSSRRITVRQLLSQTSGISVATSENTRQAPMTATARWSIGYAICGRRISIVLSERSFEYSGTNYAILGLLVQLVSGVPYERYVQDRIFTPLQMLHTYTSRSEAAAHGLSTGYLDWFGFPRAADLPFNREVCLRATSCRRQRT